MKESRLTAHTWTAEEAQLALWIVAPGDHQARYRTCKAMAVGYAESLAADELRAAHARAFTATVLHSYWTSFASRESIELTFPLFGESLPSLVSDAANVAEETGRLMLEFPEAEAPYLIGSIYTAMLPSATRSAMGAFYTPPPLVTRLLDLSECAGFDSRTQFAIDPACCGGVFLVAIARRMASSNPRLTPTEMLRHIAAHLHGIELDPFAAWMSGVLLEAEFMPLFVAARERFPKIVDVGDALQMDPSPRYDLVAGNPPYGRVTLSKEMRHRYARSLFGHANLYGMFIDLALRIANSPGVVAYVTPTSFLAGQYSMTLRALISAESAPTAFDFIMDRDGVFDDVLQETMLATYRKGSSANSVAISGIIPRGLDAAKIDFIGSMNSIGGKEPWLLPRSQSDLSLLAAASGMPTRLGSLGFAVSTGPLVWNRHKDQLRAERAGGCIPIVWAESVASGRFEFSSKRRDHMPYLAVKNQQPHLVTRRQCLLMPRTTSKEQTRRLTATLLPQAFLDDHGGAVIENHVNMIYSAERAPELGLDTVSYILNSPTVDRLFRCMNGSVAVSAYEINALPLPPTDELMDLEDRLRKGATEDEIDSMIAGFYGVGDVSGKSPRRLQRSMLRCEAMCTENPPNRQGQR